MTKEELINIYNELVLEYGIYKACRIINEMVYEDIKKRNEAIL